MLPLCTHTHTHFLTHRSLNVLVFFFNFHSAVCLSKLSDWQLNIDGLEIAEVQQMLSVLRRGKANTNEKRMGKYCCGIPLNTLALNMISLSPSLPSFSYSSVTISLSLVVCPSPARWREVPVIVVHSFSLSPLFFLFFSDTLSLLLCAPQKFILPCWY